MRFVHSTTVRLAIRFIAAVPGGYALTAGMVAVMGSLLSASGLPRSESVVVAAMVGFLFYLALLLWAFAERRLARLCGVILGGLCFCSAALWLIQPGG